MNRCCWPVPLAGVIAVLLACRLDALEESAFALRKGRLLELKREMSDMMKRCA